MLGTTNGQDPIVGGENQDQVKSEGDASYEKLLQEYDNKFKNLEEGDIINGRVIKVTSGEVIVDIGHKSEGVIPIHEFVESDGKIRVKAGDEIAVLLEDHETTDGYLKLSREKAERIRVMGPNRKGFS